MSVLLNKISSSTSGGGLNGLDVSAGNVAGQKSVIFDGLKTTGYLENDKPNPLNYYGHTKLLGEKSLEKYCKNYLIVRTSWLYGAGGPSFVHTIAKLAKTKSQLGVINDQLGCPTSTTALANHLILVVESGIKGILHLTCSGRTSWYDFAKKIFELLNIDIKVSPLTSEEYPTPAKRPSNSYMRSSRLSEFSIPEMPKWDHEITEFINSNKQELI